MQLLLIADTHVPRRARTLLIGCTATTTGRPSGPVCPRSRASSSAGYGSASCTRPVLPPAGKGGATTGTPGLDVLVFGHSHIPWDTTTPRGMRLLNPGSPTDKRRQPHDTFLTAAVHDGALTDVRLHRLVRPAPGPRPMSQPARLSRLRSDRDI